MAVESAADDVIVKAVHPGRFTATVIAAPSHLSGEGELTQNTPNLNPWATTPLTVVCQRKLLILNTKTSE